MQMLSCSLIVKVKMQISYFTFTLCALLSAVRRDIAVTLQFLSAINSTHVLFRPWKIKSFECVITSLFVFDQNQSLMRTYIFDAFLTSEKGLLVCQTKKSCFYQIYAMSTA